MNPWAVAEFRTGLAVGLVTAAALLVAVVVHRRRAGARLAGGRFVSFGGTGVAVGGTTAIALDGTVPWALPLGAAAVGVAVAVAARRCWPTWAAVGLAVPGAVLVALAGGLPGVGWIRLLVAVGASVGAALVAEGADRWERTAVSPLLLAVSTIGVYLTVPDTEEAAALVAVALVVAVLAWPLGLVTLGGGGAAATTVLVCWVAGVGGAARPSSIIGAIASLGLLVGHPVARSALRRRAPVVVPPTDPVAVGQLVASHLAVVLLASRVAGLREGAAEATALAVVALVAAVLLGALFTPGGDDGGARHVHPPGPFLSCPRRKGSWTQH